MESSDSYDGLRGFDQSIRRDATAAVPDLTLLLYLEPDIDRRAEAGEAAPPL